MLKLSPPSPGALERVSPSRATDLLACPYRVAFQLDRRFDALRRPTPAALLGTVAHAVVEAASTGLVPPGATAEEAQAQLASRFDALVEHAGARLDAAWAPARPPRPADWPGYHLIRVRALRRASELRSGSRAQRSGIGVEVDLRDATTALVGRPDRVEQDGATTRVVDLKSGLSQGPSRHRTSAASCFCTPIW